MDFDKPLIPARLIRRYKRFLADVRLDSAPDGAPVTVHCPDPGAMTGLTTPGARVWLAPARNPKARLPYSWEMIETASGLVGINTHHPNRLVREALDGGRIAPLARFGTLRAEVPYGENSRIDFLLSSARGPDTYLEVKNVHLRRDGTAPGGLAEFPDTVTRRGAKHMRELAAMTRAGHRAVVLYVVQRMDCDRFAVAGDIDPDYAAAAWAAREAGVAFLAYQCDLSLTALSITDPMPVIWPDRPPG